MNNKTKKNIKYAVLILLLGISMYLLNVFVIHDWRIKNSEARVQKSIVTNYQKNNDKFHDLVDFLQDIEIRKGFEIEFLKRSEFSGSIYNESKPSSNHMVFSSVEGMEGSYDEFELQKNGVALVNYIDTTFESQNWEWYFRGGNTHKDFERFINYAGMSLEDFGLLRNMIEGLDCEAIHIHEDKSIAIRYDGYSMYQYEYRFIGKNVEPPYGFERLEDGIYSGLYDAGLCCSAIIFDK